MSLLDRFKRGQAHAIIHKMLRANLISKPPHCGACLTTTKQLHAHHEDYDRPYDIFWLCRSCHALRHSKRYSDLTNPI